MLNHHSGFRAKILEQSLKFTPPREEEMMTIRLGICLWLDRILTLKLNPNQRRMQSDAQPLPQAFNNHYAHMIIRTSMNINLNAHASLCLVTHATKVPRPPSGVRLYNTSPTVEVLEHLRQKMLTIHDLAIVGNPAGAIDTKLQWLDTKF